MAKILICAGVPGWSTEQVIKGITPYIDHDIEITYYWIGGYEPSDWDVIYIHSGAVMNGDAKDYVMKHRNDTKWIIGIRGPTAYKRNFHAFERGLWDAYSAGSVDYKNQCLNDEIVPGYVCHGSIDTRLFPLHPLPDEFKIGWAGKPSNGTKRFQRFLDLPFEKHIASPSGGYNRKVFGVKTKAYSYQMMPNFYKEISVYVNTSYKEGGPLPTKEAACSGRPCVITETGDGPEWIPEEYITWNRKNDFGRDRMINMIENLKYNRKLLEYESERFHKLAQRFDHSVVAKEYETMFNEVI